MNKLLAFALAFLMAFQVMAQQKPQYSQYTLNNYILNPAISGIEDYADLRMGIRQQWAGLEGAPQSYYASLHMPINKDVSPSNRGGKTGDMPKSSTKRTNVYRRVRPHHGVGAMAMTTRTGPLKRSSLSASYAFHLPLSRTTRLAAGVAPGIVQYSLDQSYVRTANANDPAVMDGRVNELKFDLTMGLWLYSQSYYVGVSGAQLVPGKRQLLNTDTPGDNDGKLQKHYFATAGYRVDVTSELSVIPSVMVKLAQPSPASVDATVKILYANRLWAGASYRHKDSMAAMAGINISPLLDVAYAYDAGTSPLGAAHAGSHEVVVGLKLRNTRKVICPIWAW
ncbi:type IX secretion system membrane protein PorP/SprF [Pontibacter sp. 172403-2]|uniref:PorP/SprF family type IX secretion system membrane protein n=1 Tax=Pontibacter rufus TaxID=2791028 RepID=UPI0018AFA03A|nr:type IX secretion system membrane protein PorP/SprF [Pontibacter sp. 172403-2]MBF9254511.1 type IX secretion system membrane protein PorP/SprF [Pontibacter sp. 172403-2]